MYIGKEDIKPLVLFYNGYIVHSGIIKVFHYRVPNLVLDYSLKYIL